MKMKKRPLGFCLCSLFLAGLTACAAAGYDSVEKAMENSLKDGNPQRAVQLGEDWLEKNKGEEDYEKLREQSLLYQELYEIYREELRDEEAALQALKKGYEATHDSQLFNLYLEESTEGKGVQQLADVFPTSEEILLDGRPFKEWSPQELLDFLPTTQDGYQDEEEEGWYRSEYYRNGSITAIYSMSEWSESLEIYFSDFNRYSNSYEEEGPSPALPRDIEGRDDLKTVLRKLGVPEDLLEYFTNSSYLTFNVSETGVDVWVEGFSGGGQYLNIEYDTRDYYGSVSFDFGSDEGLNGYRVSHRMR